MTKDKKQNSLSTPPYKYPNIEYYPENFNNYIGSLLQIYCRAFGTKDIFESIKENST